MKTFKNIPSYTLPTVATAASGQALVSDGYFNCMENEIWKDVKGYEGVYKISNLGNLKSKYRKNNIINYLDKDKNIRRYFLVELYFNKEIKRTSIHRLVAEHFIPNPENRPQVNHINGIKRDNRVENLEWATCSENIQHAYNTGLKSKVFYEGERNNKCKLKKEQVIEIYYSTIPRKQIQKDYNVSKRLVSLIQRGLIWKSVLKDLPTNHYCEQIIKQKAIVCRNIEIPTKIKTKDEIHNIFLEDFKNRWRQRCIIVPKTLKNNG